MTPPVLRQAVLLAAILALMSGSAYAGGKLAANSVGSKQVKNSSLTSKDVRNRSLKGADVKDGSLSSADVRDGSLTRADLATGTVPRTYTVMQHVPEGTTRVLDVPGFSRFDVTCSATSISLEVGFGDATPTASDPFQEHGLAASDIADNSPKGGATVRNFSGGVGFSSGAGSPPASGVLVRGDYWGRSRTLIAHGTFAWGSPAVPCLFQLQVVVQERSTPVEVTRPAGRGTTSRSACERVGDAFCLPPGDEAP